MLSTMRVGLIIDQQILPLVDDYISNRLAISGVPALIWLPSHN